MKESKHEEDKGMKEAKTHISQLKTRIAYLLYFAISLFTAYALIGCSSSDEVTNDTISIKVESSGIESIPQNGSIELYFSVSPANADFTYSNGTYDARLYYYSSKGKAFEAYISSVENVGNGRYKSLIIDRNDDELFQINVCIGVTVSGSTYYSDMFCIQNHDIEAGIKTMSFLKENNPELEADVHCEFDEKTNTFTGRSMKWRGGLVDATNLKATFISAGEVMVNGVAQKSGITSNDFTKPVIYTIKDGGKEIKYSVKFINFTDLPVVYVNSSTNQQPINADITSKTEWKSATIRIEGNGQFEDLQEVPMQLRGRGNVTWDWEKKAFNIKFPEQQKILGMKKHKRWIMLANYADITMLRNDVAYRISDLTSLNWAPKGQHVELVYNNQYTGTYYLCEQVRVDKNRVNITELPEAPDGTTITNVEPDKVGYLVEFDFHEDTSPRQWATTFHHTKYGAQSIYLVKYPEDDEITDAQFEYIRSEINNLETQLKTIKENPTATEEQIEKQFDEVINALIDPLSFIDYWLVYEVCINHEILNPGSVYLHKNAGGKFFAGPTWDFDYGTFNFTYGEAQPAKTSLYVSGAVWYRYLFRNPKMKAMAKARWEELKPQIEQMSDYILEKSQYLKYAAEENYERWPMTIGTNGDSHLGYEASIAEMRRIFKNRINIIDNCMKEW